MIIDRLGVRSAWRTPEGVEVRDLRFPGFAPDPFTPPKGQFVVAWALESPFGHVTSDGQTLWIWNRPHFHPIETDPPPINLTAAAKETLKHSWLEYAVPSIAELAAMPMGPLRHAMFSLAQMRNDWPPPTPRWPTLIFGCGEVLVASQLDYFPDRTWPRRFAMSPSKPERRILAFPTDLYAVSILELLDGSTVVGNAEAEVIAFDDEVYSAQTRVDCEPPTHGAVVVDTGDRRWLFGVAGESEIVVGRYYNGGAVKLLARFAGRKDERLIGVTPRGEALVTAGHKILARTADGDVLIVEATHVIEEATATLNYGLYRSADPKEPRPVAFRF